MHGKHTLESHSKDRVRRGVKLPQKAAVASAVRVQSMATPTDARRSLNIVDKARRDEVYISPSKGRAVWRKVAKVRQEVLSEFLCGEKVDRTEVSHTHMCAKTFIKDLVTEHNRPGGAHLQLHAPVCVGHQFSHGRTLACFSTPFLLLNAACGFNDGWPLQLHFDSTGGISDSKIDVLGITTNSLRNKSEFEVKSSHIYGHISLTLIWFVSYFQQKPASLLNDEKEEEGGASHEAVENLEERVSSRTFRTCWRLVVSSMPVWRREAKADATKFPQELWSLRIFGRGRLRNQ